MMQAGSRVGKDAHKTLNDCSNPSHLPSGGQARFGLDDSEYQRNHDAKLLLRFKLSHPAAGAALITVRPLPAEPPLADT